MNRILAKDARTGTKLIEIRPRTFKVVKGKGKGSIFGNINKATDIFLLSSGQYTLGKKNKLTRELKKKMTR